MELDVISNINSINRDIVIELDNSTHWSDYVKQFSKKKLKDEFFEKNVNDLPKSSKGNRCYLSYNNKIYAWVEIYSITKKAKYTSIKMFPYLTFVIPSIDCSGFAEDYRYFYDNSKDQ